MLPLGGDVNPTMNFRNLASNTNRASQHQATVTGNVQWNVPQSGFYEAASCFVQGYATEDTVKVTVQSSVKDGWWHCAWDLKTGLLQWGCFYLVGEQRATLVPADPIKCCLLWKPISARVMREEKKRGPATHCNGYLKIMGNWLKMTPLPQIIS